MKRAPALALCLAGAAVLLVGASSLYTVGQSQQALVLRFGQPERAINAGGASSGPGLYARWPFAERVVRLDRRELTVQGDPVEVTTADDRRLVAGAALSYRIVDPLQAYRSLGRDKAQAGDRLKRLLDASVLPLLRAARLPDIVAEGQGALTRSALLAARRGAKADGLGVEITDVSLTDVVPPPVELQALERRMQEAATQQAVQLRLDAETHKREAMAQADREALDIRGEGERQALEVRGQGDAERAAILGAAYGQDPEFARFFRRLEAYDQALNPDNTTMVLSPDSAFLDLFGQGPGGGPKPR